MSSPIVSAAWYLYFEESYLYKMRLHIKVKPNSGKNEVVKESDRTTTVRIKAAPVEGKANKYLTTFLAEYFKVSKSQIIQLKGGINRYKTIKIEAEEEYIHKKLGQ